MKTAEKDLKNIKIHTTDKGFTVWITERKKMDGKMKTIMHWVVDASLLKEEGQMRLGRKDIWNLNAEYNEKDNAIYIIRKK